MVEGKDSHFWGCPPCNQEEIWIRNNRYLWKMENIHGGADPEHREAFKKDEWDAIRSQKELIVLRTEDQKLS